MNDGGKKEIVIALHAGFCFGVKRAVEMAEKNLKEKNEPVYIIGSLVHNDQVMDLLEKRGLKKIAGIDEVPEGGKLIIRSHGITKDIIEKAKEKNIEVIDATCPFVRKARLVAEDFHKKNYDVLICGDKNHAEIVGINSWIDNQGIIIGDPEEVAQVDFKKNTIGILSQTTYKRSFLEEVVKKILERGKKSVVIENTICLDSSTKQDEIKELAQKVDVMIVVGGKSSSNTNKLAEISRSQGAATYHIETKEELKKEWLVDAQRIGIAAGASTAQFLVDEVSEEIRKISK